MDVCNQFAAGFIFHLVNTRVWYIRCWIYRKECTVLFETDIKSIVYEA